MAKGRSRTVAMDMRDWEAEEDLRTYQRYCEIKMDPKRMSKVKELAKARLEEMAMIAAKTNED
jgi:hypothetical protein